MNNEQQNQVRAFMRAFDQDLEVFPQCPSADVIKLRKLLIIEECAELVDAFDRRSIEDIAKECADVLYVVLGAANACGFDLAAVFEEVHKSNMSKIGGKKNADGKVLKPAGYRPANVRAALRAW